MVNRSDEDNEGRGISVNWTTRVMQFRNNFVLLLVVVSQRYGHVPHKCVPGFWFFPVTFFFTITTSVCTKRHRWSRGPRLYSSSRSAAALIFLVWSSTKPTHRPCRQWRVLKVLFSRCAMFFWVFFFSHGRNATRMKFDYWASGKWVRLFPQRRQSVASERSLLWIVLIVTVFAVTVIFLYPAD